MNKLRGVIALAVVVSLAAVFGGARGPDKKADPTVTSTTTVVAVPGLFRGR